MCIRDRYYTILTQIEACLNSRPLFAISSDSRDPEPLTPAHFLVGFPLTALPESDYSQINITRLGRWQLLQRFTQSIWNRWSKDYLHQLQQRNKWRSTSKNLTPGQLVLILDDNSPPSVETRGSHECLLGSGLNSARRGRSHLTWYSTSTHP